MAKIFTLKFDSLTGTFDDGPLQEFLTHKEVLSLREHFFVKDEIPLQFSRTDSMICRELKSKGAAVIEIEKALHGDIHLLEKTFEAVISALCDGLGDESAFRHHV